MKSAIGVLFVASLMSSAYADTPAPQATTTRATVLAELDLYRQSGLYWLESAEIAPTMPEYRSAASRYAELLASPAFAALVQKYSGHPGTP